MRTLPLAPVALAALLAIPGFAASSRLAWAEDPPASPPANPPSDEPPKKASHDDTSIFKDYQFVKKKGASYARERAEFWAGKGLTGKDLFYLGLMHNRAEESGKATDALEGYLKWTPPDEKAKETFEKNKELSYQTLISAYAKQKEWAKSVDACERYRKDIPGGKITGETWDDQGRAHRLAGDEAKAAEAFKNAADLKITNGILDLADISLCNGDVAGAKAVIEKYMATEISDQAKVGYLTPYAAFLGAVGTPAPSLEKAVSVGKDAAPTDWTGKPAVFLYWTLQTGNGDVRLQRLYILGRDWPEKAHFAGLMTYVKYNADTKKVEEDLTPAKEAEWMLAFIAQSSMRIPPCIVIPTDVFAGMRQKYEGQLTVIDGAGKFRYMRTNDTTTYDIACVDMALKKITETAAPEK